MEVDNLQPINKLSVANSGTSNLLDSSDWAFDKVILPDDDEWIETKDLIRTLIRDHTNVVSRKEPGIPAPLHDLVEGKGKGLVILLYGNHLLASIDFRVQADIFAKVNQVSARR